MRIQYAVITAMMLAAMGVSQGYAASTVSGNVNFMFGEKMLDSDDWHADGGPDLANQLEFGILFDIRPVDWPINLVVDLLGSSHKDEVDGIDVEGKTSELAFGVRKYFGEQAKGKFLPYVGGGLAHVTAEEKAEFSGLNISVDDSGLGFWADGGVKFMPTDHLNLGLDVRYSKATLTFGDEDIEAGGVHFGLFVGYGF